MTIAKSFPYLTSFASLCYIAEIISNNEKLRYSLNPVYKTATNRKIDYSTQSFNSKQKICIYENACIYKQQH